MNTQHTFRWQKTLGGKRLLVAMVAGIGFTACLGTAAVAGPMVVSLHNGITGVRQQAIMECLQAVHDDGAFARGVVLTSVKPTGGQTYILVGTMWNNGERAPIRLSCTNSQPGRGLAKVVRVDDGTAVAQSR